MTMAIPQVVPLPEVGPIVLAEENKIRQVVTNLVGNAMRFTPDDSPIEFAVEVDREGGFGQISIVDHGEGVPPQLREKIFQRFWRADTSRTRDTGGSGTGPRDRRGHRGQPRRPRRGPRDARWRRDLPRLPSSPHPAPKPARCPRMRRRRRPGRRPVPNLAA